MNLRNHERPCAAMGKVITGGYLHILRTVRASTVLYFSSSLGLCDLNPRPIRLAVLQHVCERTARSVRYSRRSCGSRHCTSSGRNRGGSLALQSALWRTESIRPRRLADSGGANVQHRHGDSLDIRYIELPSLLPFQQLTALRLRKGSAGISNSAGTRPRRHPP